MIFAALLFIILGLLIKNGKMYNLIAGYNTLTEDEKKRYDIEGIATVFRNTMVAMALIVIAGYLLGLWLDHDRLDIYALFLATLTGVPYLLIQANSKKFKKDAEDHPKP